MEGENSPSLNRKERFGKLVKEYLKEYCRTTSIHGCKYLGESRSLFEKIWWFIILAASMICCVLMIHKTYEKWKSSPVIVTFATTETPIYELPFPAITICPETKIKKEIFNYTRVAHKLEDQEELTEYERKAFSYYSLICDRPYLRKILANVYNQSADEDLYDFIDDAKPDFENFFACFWMGTSLKCSDAFSPILTDEGICYTFNMLDRLDFYTSFAEPVRDFHNIGKKLQSWNTATFQYENTSPESYPLRAYVPGAKMAFSVMLVAKKADLDYACKNSVQGFKVLLHHPANVPRLSQRFFRVPVDQSVSATVQPSVITTSKSVLNYEPSKRHCYFSHERKLKFFKVYTQDNCDLECEANFTQLLCNCTKFYAPREPGSKICGSDLLDCVSKAEDMEMMFKIFRSTSFLYPEMREKFENPFTNCDCLPGCSSINYDVEISQSDWNWQKQLEAYRIDQWLNLSKTIHVSNLHIFLKTSHIMGLERHELYGPTDFIANFGGLLGLFVGFSIISFVEIVYFLTLRIFCNFRFARNKSNM